MPTRASRTRSLFDGRAANGASPYERLLDLIVRGDLPPASRLTEPTVTDRLGVSRTPAREAMQRLELEGLLVPDGGGARPRLAVAPLDREEAREIYRSTGLLEGAAVRRIAEWPARARRQLAERLAAEDVAFRREARRRDADPAELYARHNGFHRQLIADCASPVTRTLLDVLRPRLARYEWFHAPLVRGAGHDFTATYVEHDAIVAAVRGEPAEAIERAVRANWERAGERLAAAIAAAAAP